MNSNEICKRIAYLNIYRKLNIILKQLIFSSKKMKIKIILLQVALFLSCNLYAQDTSLVHRNHSASIEIVGITYNFENPIALKSTLIVRCGLQGGIGYSSSFGSNYYYAVSPAISIEPRFYYNINKRYRRGKLITGNSASFISLSSWYIFNPIYEHNVSCNSFFVVTPQWGVRKIYWHHLLLEAGLGISYFFDTHGNDDLGIMMNLRIGYSF